MELITQSLTIVLIICLVFSFYLLIKSLNKTENNFRLIKRNQDLLEYKKNVLKRGLHIYDKLPPYYEMLYSKKPLTDKHWLNEI